MKRWQRPKITGNRVSVRVWERDNGREIPDRPTWNATLYETTVPEVAERLSAALDHTPETLWALTQWAAPLNDSPENRAALWQRYLNPGGPTA